MQHLTARRVAIALTIWFTALNLIVLFRLPVTDRFFVLAIPALYSYFLLPVRWLAVTTVFVQTGRARPFRRLPRSPVVLVPIVIVVQLVLGLLSFVGWWALWSETSKTGDRVFGFVLHAAIPSLLVAFLARRSAAAGRPEQHAAT
jgi:hypothetical protein